MKRKDDIQNHSDSLRYCFRSPSSCSSNRGICWGTVQVIFVFDFISSSPLNPPSKILLKTYLFFHVLMLQRNQHLSMKMMTKIMGKTQVFSLAVYQLHIHLRKNYLKPPLLLSDGSNEKVWAGIFRSASPSHLNREMRSFPRLSFSFPLNGNHLFLIDGFFKDSIVTGIQCLNRTRFQ